jgi:large subunit ribosomal protein L10
MEGQIGAIFAFEDPFAPMKAANAFAKTHEHLKILGGYFENEIQSAVSIVAIASLPSREELLARLVGTLAAPMSGFARVLQGNIKGLVYVLAQRAKTNV